MYQINLPIFLLPTILFAHPDSQENDSKKKAKLAGIPLNNYNISLGIMPLTMGSMYYKLNVNDTIAPFSPSMLFGMFMGNKSYMGLVVLKYYSNEAKWRTKVAGGSGDAALLPSMGVGGCYLMIAKKNNLGEDFGIGKNDHSLAFRTGEAFSR